MSATNCLIKDVPDVFYLGQIRGICWPMKHTEALVIQKLSAHAGDVWSGIVVLEMVFWLTKSRTIGQSMPSWHLTAFRLPTMACSCVWSPNRPNKCAPPPPCATQGLYSLSGKTSYRQILWSLEAVRLDVAMVVSLWNLTGTSAAALPRYLPNFRAIAKV